MIVVSISLKSFIPLFSIKEYHSFVHIYFFNLHDRGFKIGFKILNHLTVWPQGFINEGPRYFKIFIVLVTAFSLLT